VNASAPAARSREARSACPRAEAPASCAVNGQYGAARSNPSRAARSRSSTVTGSRAHNRMLSSIGWPAMARARSSTNAVTSTGATAS